MSPSVDNLSIGRRIRFFRKEAGLTLSELGERVGRAASQISTIENGKRETSVTLLASIAQALGTEVADLLDPTPVDGRQALELEA
ncbi:helix-turn-helix transcriptional regulator, partial [Mycobacterium tuberculosis]|nr:helix-turn-helix transcriptional regulator [Mycobacterium tuberculosis]